MPEGEWPASQQVVVVEFFSKDQLRRWYDSDEYAEARAISKTALSRRLLFVNGLPSDAQT